MSIGRCVNGNACPRAAMSRILDQLEANTDAAWAEQARLEALCGVAEKPEAGRDSFTVLGRLCHNCARRSRFRPLAAHGGRACRFQQSIPREGNVS